MDSVNNIVITPANYLKYQKDFTPSYVEQVIKRENLGGLSIFAQLQEDRVDSFDFLKEYSFLQGLSIASRDDYNYDFLKSLGNLKSLTISNFGNNQIDLSNQVNLEFLCLEWRNNITGLKNCQKITELCLWNFKEDDLQKVEFLNCLKTLAIKTSSIKSLDGVQKMTSLEKALLGNCRTLRSIKGINGLQKLKELELTSCTKIEDYSFLTILPELENLQLIDCKDIQSIGFIKNFPKLKKFVMLGNTNVLDSDLLPAKDIVEVIYGHRKHYNIKIENKKSDELMKQNLERIRSSYKS